jgi:hypothetical protein
MNTNTIFLAIGVAAVLSIVVAPALVESASAKKQEITICPSGNPCQGNSGEKNPNREEKCVAGSKLQEKANCP